MENLYLAMMITMPTVIPALLSTLIQTSGTLSQRVAKAVTLDPLKGLLHQRFFWLCIAIPLIYFFTFGYVAWNGYSIELSSDGLANFLSISTLPLGLLSISLPLTVVAASFHSTHQTAIQIKQTKYTYEQEIIRRRKEEDKILINTLKLIRTELLVAWDIYESEYAVDLKKTPPTEPFLNVFPLGDNLFPIYDSAPVRLADSPIEISQEIVRIYMRMKGLVTMINNNNVNTANVHERAMAIFQKRSDEARLAQVDFTREFTDHLQSSFERHRLWEARNLGMDGDVNSMKLLTDEIEKLLASIITKLDAHIAKNDFPD